VAHRPRPPRGGRRPLNMFNPDASGRVWLPDAVAWLWAALSSGSPALWRSAYDAGLGPPRTVEDVADLLGRDGVRWRAQARAGHGWLPAELVAELDGLPQGPQLWLRLLVALDRACDGLALHEPRLVPELAEIAEAGILDERGNLARSGDTLVLRRGSPVPSGGASLGHYLANLVVLDALVQGAYDVRARALPEDSRLAHRRSAAAGELAVAFVPVLDEIEDARFVARRVGTHARFALELSPAKQARLIARAPELVAELETAGVELALLPETCATPALVEALRQALRRNHRARGCDPSLRLMLVGRLGKQLTLGNPAGGWVGLPERDLGGVNEVVVLSGAGRTIMTQRKQQPWRLDGFQIQRYGLEAAFSERGTLVERDEDLSLAGGAQLHAVDDAGFGRLIILICEDLQRCDPARQIAVHLAPTDVASPVMDSSLAVHRWACKAANAVADEPGAVVMVVNSCFMSLLERRGAPGAVGVGYVAHPAWPVRSTLGKDVVSSDFPYGFKVVRIPRPG